MGIEPLKSQLPDRSDEKERNDPEAEHGAGWDPYQVWRTRVLLPRLNNEVARPAHRVPGNIQSHRTSAADQGDAGRATDLPKPKLKQVGI